MMSSSCTEDLLVEQPAIQLMQHELGWDSVNAYDEWASGTSTLGRESKREVVLTGRHDRIVIDAAFRRTVVPGQQ